jgi:hypothetical protein
LWEFTPYRVQILVAADAEPGLPASLAADLQRGVQERIEALVGSPWDVETVAASAGMAHTMRWRFDAVAAADLPPTALHFDKALLVRISRLASGYRVAARDFDLRAQVLGAAAVHDVAERSLLGTAAVDAILEAFAPLGQVDVVEAKQSQIRLRAAALPTRDPDLPVLTQGSVFIPALRFNNSDGSLKSVRTIPWTFLASEPRGGPAEAVGGQAKLPERSSKAPPADPTMVNCRIYSGLRNPLSSRRRGRSEQLAVAVNPPRAATRVELFSVSEPDYPLGGYEVHAQRPGSAATAPLGLTDYRGVVNVPPDEAHPLRILIVKNGGEPVARLPVLAGWEPSLRALVTNDEQRLRVEGFITGLQERAVDTVARRELLMARIQARLSAGQVPQAETLFQQLKALPSLGAFQQELQIFERSVQTNDPRLKRKIDKLLADTRKVLETHLAEQRVTNLASELQAAKGATGTAGASSGAGGT